LSNFWKKTPLLLEDPALTPGWKRAETKWSLADFGQLAYNHGEFDPGSERTLAARFKHASRTVLYLRVQESGERVSNT
jgi:hypothetical protein